MEYKTDQQLYDYFTHEMDRLSSQTIEALRKEIMEQKNEEIKEYKEDLEKQINRYLNIELKEINTDFSSEINKIHIENNRKLIEKREGFMEEVFTEVKEKLQAFTKTKMYKETLIKQLKDAISILKSDDIVLSYRSKDDACLTVFKSLFNNQYSLKEDAAIEIGGFIAASQKKGREINQTLDKKLEARKDWFYKNSKLYIRS
ncbi:MAG: V-type ATP synthase subunit E [Bacillota bacterium]